MITKRAKLPDCTVHHADPGQGLDAFCLCDGTTLPITTPKPFTAESQSCAYTKMPDKPPASPITKATTTYTKNCEACTLVGGMADKPTCTKVKDCKPTEPPKPQYTVKFSNNYIQIGDANLMGDKVFAKEIFDGLSDLCPYNAPGCGSKDPGLVVKGMETIVEPDPSNYPEEMEVTFTITDSNYGVESREPMLAYAIATWQRISEKKLQRSRLPRGRPPIW